MKIILIENIETLGKIGDIISVKKGYARNYLFPRGFAQSATEKNIQSAQKLIELRKQLKENKIKYTKLTQSNESINLILEKKH